MEGFNTPVGSGDYSDPLASAADDVRRRCGGAVEVYWDGENRSADYEVHKLKVIARDLPLVFPVEHDVLVERGKPYEGFLDSVVAQVQEVLRGKAAAPPTA
jgi:hypothetical protein